MKLSEKIYTCRKRAGLSQDALAEQIGVSRQAISKWENGEALPETSKLLPLSHALGVSIDWLLDENDPVENVGTFPKSDPSTENTGDARTMDAEDTATEPTADGDTNTTNAHGKDTADTEPMGDTAHTGSTQKSPIDTLDWLPGFLTKLFRQYGWLGGVYLAVGGGGIALIGGIAKILVGSMVRSFENVSSTLDPFGMNAAVIYDEYGNQITGEMAEFLTQELQLSGSGMGAAQQFAETNPVSVLAGILIALGIATMLGGLALALWLYKQREE